MAEESAQEKTEDPTPKRLEKALEDGQVLTSKGGVFRDFFF